jgi:hypothetical protein
VRCFVLTDVCSDHSEAEILHGIQNRQAIVEVDYMYEVGQSYTSSLATLLVRGS